MDTKYLEVTVKNEQTQLVRINDIIIVEQAADNKVEITYVGGKKVTINHDTMAANNEEVRDRVESTIVDALQTKWRDVVHPLSLAGIADTGGAVPEVTSIDIA
jgi:hypothetical protein|tara:strand:+ start:2717 stop:3025 length:309 start_codon:yes stop_codon:yes gene_type:complete